MKTIRNHRTGEPSGDQIDEQHDRTQQEFSRAKDYFSEHHEGKIPRF